MPNMKVDPRWCVVEDSFDLTLNRSYESLFALGTGYLTTRASIDEGFFEDDQARSFDRFMGNTTLEKMKAAKSKWGSYMPVVQADHPYLKRGMVNLPYYLGLTIYANDEKLDLEFSNILSYRRWLDLSKAILYRTLEWKTRDGQVLAVEFERFMNPARRFTCVQRCTVRLLAGTASIKAVAYIDNDIRTNGYDCFVLTSVGREEQVLYSDVTTNVGERIAVASYLVCSRPVELDYSAEARRISTATSFNLAAGEEVVLTKYSAVAADAYFPRDTIVADAVSLVLAEANSGYSRLRTEHVSVWEALWSEHDVRIDADDRAGYDSQLAIRFSIYHLLRAKAPDEERGALCPKGSTAETYYGSIFWDTDMFHLPYYAYTNPPAARSQAMFRCRTLAAARELARRMEYPGARYPWQADNLGGETCVLWQYADHQVHITADVAIGVWHYYKASGDEAFLFDYGAEVLIETARYWLARVDTVPDRPGLQILGVMGPDEYKPLTNNNAYTNFTARLNLRVAAESIALMRDKVPAQFTALAERLGLAPEEELEFVNVAARIALPQDPVDGTIWQCDGFPSAFAEFDIEDIWKDRSRLFGSYVSQERRYRSKCMKQADVVALMAIFPSAFPKDIRRRSTDYNAKYCIHDSSNSMSHHAMAYANTGRPAAAYEYWLGAIRIDLWDRTRSSDGIHMTNVAGMWQALVFGFCGMSSALDDDELRFDPRFPVEFRSIGYRAQWRGQRFEVAVQRNKVVLRNLSAAALTFEAGGRTAVAPPGGQAELLFTPRMDLDAAGQGKP